MEKRTLLTLVFSFLAIGFCCNAHAMERKPTIDYSEAASDIC